MSSTSSTKPHRSYSDLVNLLESRGMIIPDKDRAERKLAQIGYYRLSGFWYPCRQIAKDSTGQYIISPTTGKPVRSEDFQDNVDFSDIIKLYLFDKKLRQLMLDAIERVEIHVRSVIAHEMGYHDPLAYQKTSFIQPRQCRDFRTRNGRTRNIWQEWQKRQRDQINRSREDCILWHKSNSRSIPFWVTVEAWDFGTMSKYYEILNRKFQNRICLRFGLSNPVTLKEWLQAINTLRNRCAHHARIWNQVSSNPIPVTDDIYFEDLDLHENACKRIFGLISVLWFLVKKIGPSSDWISNVADLIDSKPSIACCPNVAMGFSNNQGFPRDKFSL